MTGCKTGDSKERAKDTHDCVSDDIMMIDAGVEKEELSYTGETHPGNNHSSRSNGRLAGNKDSPKKGCSLVEKTSVEPSVVISAQAIVDPDINADTNDPLEITAKADGTHLDPPDTNVPIQRSLKIQAEDQMKLDVGNATNEEELNYRETRTELLPKNETNEKTSNNEVRGMKLPSENEIKAEEFNVGVSEMELSADIETKEGELHTVVTGMELRREIEIKEQSSNTVTGMEVLASNEIKEESPQPELDIGDAVEAKSSNKSFLLEPNASGCDESGTEDEQASFMKELETFHKERCLEFKPPRFYGEPLNCLKLWRAVVRLGGYEQVTSCKLWRQVGESFKPPKTCTTVSWTFRCFYEKALLEYEKHKMRSGELPFNDVSFIEPISAGDQGVHQASGSGRARRGAAARAMQGWHSQRLLGNGEVGDPIIKDKNSTTTPKREKQLKSIGFLKRKKPSSVERAVKAARLKASKAQSGTMVVDIGPSADWVKINVQKTKDCFEVYALVPGLLREEVRVQSDPAGRLVISGQPEQLDNPWGVIPFKKVVSLPSRIDPHQTSAVVTLHGQLFVRVPFEQSDL